MTDLNRLNLVAEAQKVLELEAKAILDIKDTIGVDFTKAIELLFKCQGKVILTGIGKSGLIARKIASTLSSTGTASVYIHPSESAHGDLGVIGKDDVIVALSNSGETQELNHLIQFSVRKDIPLISLTKSKSSSLGQASTVVIEVNVNDDACPMGLAPTSSTTATLALGDALAVTLLKKRGFRAEDFAEYHPGGMLGKRLLTRVKDLMHSEKFLPLVSDETNMKEIIAKMTSSQVRGTAGVTDASGTLIGSITDGDIRRALDSGKNVFDLSAKNIMKTNPKTIDQNELAEKALRIMESHSIQSLFVVDINSANLNKPIGLLHIQDLLKAKIR